MAGEPGVLIRNYGQWQTVKLIGLPKIQLCLIYIIKCLLVGNKVKHLRKPISHNKY